MARILILDSGPLGLACQSLTRPEALTLLTWLWDEAAEGAYVIIPEIADYEVRRSLLRNHLRDSLDRLDKLPRTFCVDLPITTAAMRRAAQLWAGARQQGQPTADDRTIDGDVILAAQALEYCSDADDWWVVTENQRHLARYLGTRAQPWRAIPPPGP